MQALSTKASAVAACGVWTTGSAVVVQGLNCSALCYVFLDQGLNPCSLHWQVDSYPLHHQASPEPLFSTCDDNGGDGCYSYLLQ